MSSRFLRRVFLLTCLLTCLLAAPSTLRAAPVLIDFEALFDGDDIGNLAAPEVTFSNAMAATAGISLNELDFPPNSGSNAAFDNGGPMRLDFIAPVANFSAYFTYATALTIEFFDASSTLLGAATSSGANNTATLGGLPPNELLTGAFSGIAFLIVTGSGTGQSFTVDDVSFDTIDAQVVIEPGTLILVGSGLLGLVRHAKRAQRRQRDT